MPGGSKLHLCNQCMWQWSEVLETMETVSFRVYQTDDLKHWKGTIKIDVENFWHLNGWIGSDESIVTEMNDSGEFSSGKIRTPQCCKVRNGHKLFVSLDWCKAPGALERIFEDFLVTQYRMWQICQDCFIACEPQCCHQRMPKRQESVLDLVMGRWVRM